MGSLVRLVVAGFLTVVSLVTTGGAVLADYPHNNIAPADSAMPNRPVTYQLGRDSWVKLAAGDFDVLMPMPAQSLTNGVTGTRLYRCSSKSNNFIISVSNPGVQKDSYKRFLQGIKQGLTTRGGKIIAAHPARGKGWSGTLLQAEFKDSAKNTTLVAEANGVPVIYTLGVNLPAMDTDSQRFMHSLVVYPSQSALLPVKRPESIAGDDAARETMNDAKRLEELGAPLDNRDSAEDNEASYPRRKGRGFLDATSITIIMPTFVLILLLIRFFSTIRKKRKP